MIIIKAPIKPTDTANHLRKPTFSPNNFGDKIVTRIGDINTNAKASTSGTSEIAAKKKIVELSNNPPRIICKNGCFETNAKCSRIKFYEAKNSTGFA